MSAYKVVGLDDKNMSSTSIVVLMGNALPNSFAGVEALHSCHANKSSPMTYNERSSIYECQCGRRIALSNNRKTEIFQALSKGEITLSPSSYVGDGGQNIPVILITEEDLKTRNEAGPYAIAISDNK
ncbi:MAG: hypothetical protein UV74_C0002G0057 [Candidatus Woesebacteria bacterium GW2011_GWB1_43_14]|uniref:Uncharacterized protein n=1 Tax=Candidatus Woesebacteria bacterium GW2011_GWB1_43_14 TaxID=1618578 RepID=A0A0G1FV11_9BACT|nr:MAG: hypothetical protein UV51_C0004G0006 [Candidatus Woesebacteria bacterium GW2011_GWC1_42_9]KKS98836.1 MAG: hypothetical protein UV74_C0002G0057 [Candidatus Woesebacteria bacterium GW2011_GWB1_43_14]